MILYIQKCKSIVILQTFFLALCQNPQNRIFSMMNQIESYLTFRRLTNNCFCKRSFLLIYSKPLKRICNNTRKVSSGLFSNSFTCCSKLVALARPKIKIWVFMKVMWPVNVSRISGVVFYWLFFEIYNCCLKNDYLWICDNTSMA